MTRTLHDDPVVRRELPEIEVTLRVIAGIWVVAAVVVVVTSLWAGSTFAGLVTLLPVAYLLYLANRLAASLDPATGRFWRVISIGLALVAATFVTFGLRALLPADVLFVLLGLIAPSALFFLTYGMWIRLQGSFGRTGTLGFFDVVLVVAIGLAYVSFLLTSDVFVGAGQGFGIGVFILVACTVVFLMTIMLVGRRRRGPDVGIGVEIVFAAVLMLSVGAVMAIFVWEFLTGMPILDVPAWIIAPSWTLVFTVAVLAPYTEDTQRRAVADTVGVVRPFWPYFLLALTPPIAIGSMITTQRDQKVAGVVGLLLVVEVLVVRQLVIIDEQRRARVRQHRLRDLAIEEAARTNVILDLALTLTYHDDPRAMCDAVATAVRQFEEGAAVAVFGRLRDGSVAVAAYGVDDPATMYSMLGQLRLTSSHCVRVAGPWFGVGERAVAALVSAVMGAAGERLGYVVVVPPESPAAAHQDLEQSLAGVADQLALALDRSGLLDAVRAATERMRESADHLGEGVAVVGPDDRVRICNAAFGRLFGTRPEEVVGEHLPPRLLARLPVAGDPGTGTWSTEIDTGTADEPRRLRVSVLLSETDPLDDGVVVLVGDATPTSSERERLTGLLDDLMSIGADDESATPWRELRAARGLAAGLRVSVEAPLARVDASLAGAHVDDPSVLADAVAGVRANLLFLYTDAAREVRG